MRQRGVPNICATAHKLTVAKHMLSFLRWRVVLGYPAGSIGQRGFQSGDAGCAGNGGTPSVGGRARFDRAPLPGAQRASAHRVSRQWPYPAFDAGQPSGPSIWRKAAMSGGPAAARSARKRPAVVGTPGMAVLFKQARDSFVSPGNGCTQPLPLAKRTGFQPGASPRCRTKRYGLEVVSGDGCTQSSPLTSATTLASLGAWAGLVGVCAWGAVLGSVGASLVAWRAWLIRLFLFDRVAPLTVELSHVGWQFRSLSNRARSDHQSHC